MRIPLLLALLAGLLAGCELTPSDIGSSAGRRRSDEAVLDKLHVSMEKVRKELTALQEASAAADAEAEKKARRSLITVQGKMKDEMGRVRARKPEFQDRDLQMRFVDEILRPWSALSREVDDLLRVSVK